MCAKKSTAVGVAEGQGVERYGGNFLRWGIGLQDDELEVELADDLQEAAASIGRVDVQLGVVEEAIGIGIEQMRAGADFELTEIGCGLGGCEVGGVFNIRHDGLHLGVQFVTALGGGTQL